jgi:DNA-binding CsgD family transcriptional regulator
VLQITPSERQALQLIAEGKAAGDIGTCLGVSTSELGRHLTTLFAKMGVTSQSDAIAAARRRGLLSGETPID